MEQSVYQYYLSLPYSRVSIKDGNYEEYLIFCKNRSKIAVDSARFLQLWNQVVSMTNYVQGKKI